MAVIYLGGDVSKGYLDACFLNAHGAKLAGSGRLDDTPTGHARLRRHLEQLRAQDAECRFEIGVEATGGLERNWLRLFSACQAPGDQVYRLNPLAVKQYRARDLHQNSTDAASAKEIALYLHSGKRRADLPYAPQDEGALVCCRLIQQQLDRAAALKNQLQILLVAAHPDLVPYCRGSLPQWLLTLLEHYPTAAALARARVETLARIPYLSATRATELHAASKRSVASLSDAAAGVAVTFLVREIRRLDQELDRLKTQLCSQFATDAVVLRLRTLPGVGLWTAVLLRLELGDFSRFPTVSALIAFTGLDPRVFHSGDGTQRLGISKRGRSAVRAALYLCVFRALREPGPIRTYYARLRQRGKLHAVAMTAAMGKLLRWAFACVRSGADFAADRCPQAAHTPELDPEIQAAAAATAPDLPEPPDPSAAPVAATEVVCGALGAPVSRREAQRRKVAPTPQASGARRARGRGTTHAT